MATLRRGEQRAAILLVTPAVLFLVAVFFVPLALFTWRSVDNSEAWRALPRTRQALSTWNLMGVPDEASFAALVADVAALDRASAAALARRLNYDEPGMRSLILALHDHALDRHQPIAAQLTAADPRWGQNRTWRILRSESGRLTSAYLLRALDLEDVNGSLTLTRTQDGAFRVIFARTFWISGVVTLLCLVLGFPVAYVLASARGIGTRLLMLAVLLPFWTSVLVRTTSWILLLQQNGILNRLLIACRLIREPLSLIYNRTGVYIAMTHVLLPFFVLPLYAVMLKADRMQLRAASMLGASPMAVFVHAYLPQVMPGVLAGLVLVFVTSIGFYITPALVGGGSDQMVSYFVAFYTNVSVNWGMAAAVGTLLLLATLISLGALRRALGGAAALVRR